MKIISADISGSLIINNQDVTATIQTSNVWSGSVATEITALNATTASLLNYTASQNSRNGTYATTGSNTFSGIQTVNSNLVVTGSITAQTLVVQTVTSSVSFVTGSTKFGAVIGNTHQFTGSVSVSGSVTATSFAGSGANLTSIPNAALNNSTISGIALGNNLATLTIGTGLSGTSYNGSTGVTISMTNTSFFIGTTSISLGRTSATQTLTGVSIDGNAATVTNGLTTGNYGSYSTFSGAVTAGSGASGGFLNAIYVGGYNRIWAFGNATAYGIGYYQGGTDYIGFHFGATATSLHTFYQNGNYVASGDVTAFSDARLKTNVKTINNALSKVLGLTGVTYNRTDLEDKSTKIGFIAQEVEKVVPEVVLYDSEKDRYGVSYGNVTALLVEAIKEQQTQIEELKTIINALTK
jgi:hypothetical protein